MDIVFVLDGIMPRYAKTDIKKVDNLKVQNEQFPEEKGFILRYTEKEI